MRGPWSIQGSGSDRNPLRACSVINHRYESDSFRVRANEPSLKRVFAQPYSWARLPFLSAAIMTCAGVEGMCKPALRAGNVVIILEIAHKPAHSVRAPACDAFASKNH